MSPVLRPFIAPAAIVALTVLCAVARPSLPASLAGLPWLGPYVAFLAAGAMALWFNRGRAFIAAMSMFCAYAGYRYALDVGPFPAKVTYTALVVLVPANVLASLMQAERGVYHHHNHRWLLVIIAELLLVLWMASAGRSGLSGVAWIGVFDHWALNSPPAPLVGRLLLALAFGPRCGARTPSRRRSSRARSTSVWRDRSVHSSLPPSGRPRRRCSPLS